MDAASRSALTRRMGESVTLSYRAGSSSGAGTASAPGAGVGAVCADGLGRSTASTSPFVMRPPGPVPLRLDNRIPAAYAMRRAIGDAAMVCSDASSSVGPATAEAATGAGVSGRPLLASGAGAGVGVGIVATTAARGAAVDPAAVMTAIRSFTAT